LANAYPNQSSNALRDDRAEPGGTDTDKPRTTATKLPWSAQATN
jgi:hypothetical protein